jgi:hypothetical protein
VAAQAATRLKLFAAIELKNFAYLAKLVQVFVPGRKAF